MSRSVDSRDASDVSSSVSSNKAEEEPKLTADVKRITESIEGIMRQLIANARDDEEILFEVAIDSQPPANPPTKAPPKEKKKKLVPDPKEYFVSGFFHPTPKVPRAYQFTRVVHAKNVKSPVTDASMSETSMNPCGKKSEKRSKHLESMTATVYSDAPEDSYTSSKCGTNEKSSFSSLKLTRLDFSI
ncbi:hypothetical protein L596_015508 [Steinernema carpocapsae]|uniref:Uncharacterized protein n=1 Tax=Steinernema carpocapsae TaxID=34508 RepID=A0A4V6A364_STECR|nr:hypothetical protein L596_015508 [Steinernema carpocapsae]